MIFWAWENVKYSHAPFRCAFCLQNSHEKGKNVKMGALGMPVLISGLHFRVMEKNGAAILKIWIFRPFLVGQGSKFYQKSGKSSNFKRANFHWKNPKFGYFRNEDFMDIYLPISRRILKYKIFLCLRFL